MTRGDAMPARPELRLVSGLPPEIPLPKRIMLSLVHPLARVDVLSSDIVAIEPQAEMTFAFTEGLRTFQMPHVKIALKGGVCAKLYALTKRIVGDPLEIRVLDEVVSSPIVREPLGLQPELAISAPDFAGAQALAERIGIGWDTRRPEIVK